LGDPVTYDDNYVYGYSPKPNQKKKRLQNSIVTINDIGLRSIHNWGQNLDKRKIIFFGDSVTYGGSYIDDLDTFAHLSCENLEDKNYICGNAGVNSYGIFNIVYRSRYDKRLDNSNLRIFVVVPDDFNRGLQNYRTAHFYMNEQKFLVPAIFEALNFISTKYNLRNYISKITDAEGEKNEKDLIDESLNLFLSEINRLNENFEKTLIFYAPPKLTNYTEDYIYQKLNTNLDIKIFNLSTELTKKMFEDTIHYNKIGHKKVSEIISKEIIKFLK